MSSEIIPLVSSPLGHTPWEPHAEPQHRSSMRHAFDDGEEELHTGPLVAFDPSAMSQDLPGKEQVIGTDGSM